MGILLLLVGLIGLIFVYPPIILVYFVITGFILVNDY